MIYKCALFIFVLGACTLKWFLETFFLCWSTSIIIYNHFEIYWLAKFIFRHTLTFSEFSWDVPPLAFVSIFVNVDCTISLIRVHVIVYMEFLNVSIHCPQIVLSFSFFNQSRKEKRIITQKKKNIHIIRTDNSIISLDSPSPPSSPVNLHRNPNSDGSHLNPISTLNPTLPTSVINTAGSVENSNSSIANFHMPDLSDLSSSGRFVLQKNSVRKIDIVVSM